MSQKRVRDDLDEFGLRRIYTIDDDVDDFIPLRRQSAAAASSRGSQAASSSGSAAAAVHASAVSAARASAAARSSAAALGSFAAIEVDSDAKPKYEKKKITVIKAAPVNPEWARLALNINDEKTKEKDMKNLVYSIFDDSPSLSYPDLKDKFMPRPLFKFQSQLYQELLKKPNSREIFWIYEEEGKVGKSTFASEVENTLGFLYSSTGKSADVAYSLIKGITDNIDELIKLEKKRLNNPLQQIQLNIHVEIRGILINIPSSSKSEAPYKFIEDLKDKKFESSKYKSVAEPQI
jgi:hypothetical protein